MTAFFRAIIRRETALDEAKAEHLAKAIAKPINRMLVWEEPGSATPVEAAPKAETPAPTTAVGEPAPTFDPYAFSAMVVLSKSGRAGLSKRLAEIRRAQDLLSLAEAQHLGIDRALKKPEELRKAIIAATEQRLADRKAAAS